MDEKENRAAGREAQEPYVKPGIDDELELETAALALCGTKNTAAPPEECEGTLHS